MTFASLIPNRPSSQTCKYNLGFKVYSVAPLIRLRWIEMLKSCTNRPTAKSLIHSPRQPTLSQPSISYSFNC